MATVVFLISKFTEGAWVVVIAIPLFIVLFLRIHAYYERARKELRIDEDADEAEPKRTIVIVPVNRVSRLTEHALCEAESLGQEVIAVTVVLAPATKPPATRTASGSTGRSGIPACRSRSSTRTTRRSSSRSSVSSTRRGRRIRTSRSSC